MNDILRISGPLTLWLASFSALYGLQGLVCSEHWARAGLDLAAGRVALALAAALSIGTQAGLLLALRSPRRAWHAPLLRQVSVALAVVATGATAWTAIPIVTTSVCS